MSSEDQKIALVDECMRQSENCGYTAVSFTIWLRWLRFFQMICQVSPIIFGALATVKIVQQTSPVSGALFTLLATVIPPVYRASKTDGAIKSYADLAGEFTNLRDRFRQCALIHCHTDYKIYEATTKTYLDRLEKARKVTLTPPELFFILSRRKHKNGHYSHDYDGAKDN